MNDESNSPRESVNALENTRDQRYLPPRVVRVGNLNEIVEKSGGDFDPDTGLSRPLPP